MLFTYGSGSGLRKVGSAVGVAVVEGVAVVGRVWFCILVVPGIEVVVRGMDGDCCACTIADPVAFF
jgi:hypothetical protein